jgi:hypothetical protein
MIGAKSGTGQTRPGGGARGGARLLFALVVLRGKVHVGGLEYG